MTYRVSLEPLQVACLFQLIGQNLGEIDDLLSCDEITESSKETLSSLREILCTVCDALADRQEIT